MTTKNETITKSAIEVLTRAFTPDEIKQREAAFGAKLDYVEGHKVIRRLNEAFNHDWSFSIISTQIVQGFVIIHGQLRHGEIIKDGIGTKQVTHKKGTTQVLDVGSDYKAATTDALKKCATLFGVALDLYDSDEKSTSKKAEPEEDPNKPIDANQIKAIPKIAGLKKADLPKLLKKYKASKVEDLTFVNAKKVITELNAS
jgi:hypothetical protein